MSLSADGMSTSASGGKFDFERLVRKFLTPDDRVDMDEELSSGMAKAAGASGAIVMPPVESVQRVREPLTQETRDHFGDVVMKALRRTDLDEEATDEPSSL